ncbi:MAG: tail fiber domain-containing protein [Bacteroidota bacterium]|nr:tail fiber domain-containing protein [Bacteroidota bacterium]
MKKLYFAGAAILFFIYGTISNPLYGQSAGIGTNVPDGSAVLDITSTARGLLIPRMPTAAILSISNPAKGLMAYDSAKNQLIVNMGSAAAPNWQNISAGSGWSLTGNSGAGAAFIGTTDNHPLLFKVKNQWSGIIDSVSQSTFFGYLSGKDSAGTPANTAFGAYALGTDLNGTGFNTAFGDHALYLNHTGYYNTAVGGAALYNNTAGSENTAVGFLTLSMNTLGFFNTAIGSSALRFNRVDAAAGLSASYNTANGAFALMNNISGSYNTAEGFQASYTDLAGNGNTACGLDALYTAYGNYNTAFGVESLSKNWTGDYNAAFGYGALNSKNITLNYRVETSQSTAAGYNSLYQTYGSQGNTALGYASGSSYNNGYYNCFIGPETDVSNADFYNVIALGYGTNVSDVSTMRVGNAATTSIGGPVGWSTISDKRVKKNIRENIPGLSFIMKLRPVTYNLNISAMEAIERSGSNQKSSAAAGAEQMAAARAAKEQIVYTGFIAQEVEQAARSVNYDFNGVDAPTNAQGLYALRYEAFVAPLVKSVQELDTESRQLKSASASLEQEFEKITQRLDALEKTIK